MGTLALTGALSVTQNDVRGLCKFRTVYLHLQQHKKVMCGRCCRLPFHIFWGIIKNISNVINHTEIRFTQRGVVDGHTKVFVDLTPCDGHFAIFPYSVSMPEKALEKMSESTCDILKS